jgi:hypothetical protein
VGGQVNPVKKRSKETLQERPRKRRRPPALDSRVEDLRRKILFLNPYSGWIPKRVRQRIMNIVDSDGETIGELETGSDGFVQVAVTVAGNAVRISYYPGRDHANLTRTSLND